MTGYKVKAVALSRDTGFQVAPIRNEIINTSSNELFKSAKSKQDVKDIYESFWNINKKSPKVKVLDITIMR